MAPATAGTSVVSLHNAIYPSPPTTQPVGTTLVRLSFLCGFNYASVADLDPGTEPQSTQIFTFAPRGVAYGLNVPDSQVVVKGLHPYDTLGTLGYITMIAEMWIPLNLVGTLGSLVTTPGSKLYNSSDTAEDTMMGFVNLGYPIL